MADAKKSSTKEAKKPAKVGSKTTEKSEAKIVETTEIKKPDLKVAKAGKRSEKAIKEAEEKVAKEVRKAKSIEAVAETENKPKMQPSTTRSKLERRGKNYKKAAELVDSNKEYSIKEALELAVKTSKVKFDATVELHMNLNVDPRQADQNIRGSIVLPSGTGKTAKVTVIADTDDAKKAKTAGADDAGNEEVFTKLDKGVIDFDVLIATPAMMPKLGKYARLLGPKGLMPNPKSGTVATDVVKAVKEAKGGKVEYRVDSTGIVHLGIGKVSFGAEKLGSNADAVQGAIRNAKPASIKGIFVKSVFVTTSMGPSIKVAQTSA